MSREENGSSKHKKVKLSPGISPFCEQETPAMKPGHPWAISARPSAEWRLWWVWDKEWCHIQKWAVSTGSGQLLTVLKCRAQLWGSLQSTEQQLRLMAGAGRMEGSPGSPCSSGPAEPWGSQPGPGKAVTMGWCPSRECPFPFLLKNCLCVWKNGSSQSWWAINPWAFAGAGVRELKWESTAVAPPWSPGLRAACAIPPPGTAQLWVLRSCCHLCLPAQCSWMPPKRMVFQF